MFGFASLFSLIGSTSSGRSTRSKASQPNGWSDPIRVAIAMAIVLCCLFFFAHLAKNVCEGVAEAGLDAMEVVYNSASSVVTTTGALLSSGVTSAKRSISVVVHPRDNCHIIGMPPEKLIEFATINSRAFKRQCPLVMSACDEFADKLEAARMKYLEDPQESHDLAAEWDAAAKNGVGMWCSHSNHPLGRFCKWAFHSPLFGSLLAVVLACQGWQFRRHWMPERLQRCLHKIMKGGFWKLLERFTSAFTRVTLLVILAATALGLCCIFCTFP